MKITTIGIDLAKNVFHHVDRKSHSLGIEPVGSTTFQGPHTHMKTALMPQNRLRQRIANRRYRGSTDLCKAIQLLRILGGTAYRPLQFACRFGQCCSTKIGRDALDAMRRTRCLIPVAGDKQRRDLRRHIRLASDELRQQSAIQKHVAVDPAQRRCGVYPTGI